MFKWTMSENDDVVPSTSTSFDDEHRQLDVDDVGFDVTTIHLREQCDWLNDLPDSLASASKVLIDCVNGVYLVWSASDVRLIRCEYHIVGSLIGSIPSMPAQVDMSTLPMELSPEEMYVLVQNDLADLCALSPRNQLPCKSNEMSRVSILNRKRAAQSQVLHGERTEELLKKAPDILFARQAKIEKRSRLKDTNAKAKQLKIKQKDLDKLAAAELSDAEKEKRKAELQQMSEDIRNRPVELIATDQTIAEIELASTDVNKYNYVTPKFPNDPDEILRAHVFMDLWLRNYFVTSGLKFGCDFLVYEGDPTTHHSTYLAYCVHTPHSRLTPTELASWSRIATQTRKLVLLCHVDVMAINDESRSETENTSKSQETRPEYVVLNWWNPSPRL